MQELTFFEQAEYRHGRCKVVRQTGGMGLYADVTVRYAEIINGPRLKLSGSEFAWLKDTYGRNAWEWPLCNEYRRGALDGIQYALTHCKNGPQLNTIEVTVVQIHVLVVDTTPETVAYAACLATWQALGVAGATIPTILDGQIIFPA